MPEHPPVEGWTPPDAGERWDIIRRSRTVAVVGASSDRARSSNFVVTYLLSSSVDFDVYLVNPREREILGRTVYPSLEALPVVPDIVDVFRRSEDLPGVAAEAIATGARVFWAQLGLWSPEAALGLPGRRPRGGDGPLLEDRARQVLRRAGPCRLRHGRHLVPAPPLNSRARRARPGTDPEVNHV